MSWLPGCTVARRTGSQVQGSFQYQDLVTLSSPAIAGDVHVQGNTYVQVFFEVYNNRSRRRLRERCSGQASPAIAGDRQRN